MAHESQGLIFYLRSTCGNIRTAKVPTGTAARLTARSVARFPFQSKPLCYVLIVVLLCTGCAPSLLGKSLNVGIGVASVADEITTRKALTRGAHEGNPILGDSAWRRTAIKGLGVGAVILLTRELEKSRPILSHVVRGIVIAGYLAASVHNAGVYR